MKNTLIKCEHNLLPSLALGQCYDCPSTAKFAMKDGGKIDLNQTQLSTTKYSAVPL